MRRNSAQSGNVFLFVLLGVVLFATLAIVISRSMRSATTTSLSGREAVLAASEILDYAQRLERGVNRLRRKSVSENDISFDNPTVSGYSHGQPDANKVFSSAGGLVSWRDPLSGVNDGSPWLFTGESCIEDIGEGGAGCGSDGNDNEELLAILPNMEQIVCTEINDKLGISGIPADSGGGHSTTKFTGGFSDGTEINLPSPYQTACVSRGGAYYFYSVLLER